MLLNYGLDLLDARHSNSWNQGRLAGIEEMQQAQSEAAKVGGPSASGKLVVEFREAANVAAPELNEYVFNPARLAVTADVKSRMKGDCAAYLPADQQPTQDQWKAIFTTSHATGVIGAAGTGKSKVLLFRVILLSQYLSVPFDQVSVLTFSRESRLEMAGALIAMLGKWQVALTMEEALRIVKTPRSALLEQVHSLPDLASCTPFEILSDQDGDAREDGRPFDTRLTTKQLAVMDQCLQQTYKANRRFAELVQALFAASLQVERLEVDNPEVIKRAPTGWRLSEVDTELCDRIEGIWAKAGLWPLEGVTPTRKVFTLRGRQYSCNGYIPQLDSYVVLGFDRAEDRFTTRNAAVRTELYKEVAIKRTLFGAYFQERLIHLDSYQDAFQLVENMKALPRTAPCFSYRLKGAQSAVPLLEAFNESATLIDNLGLEVASVPGKMNFVAGDTDAAFFEALGIYWQALERHLHSLHKPSITFGRLFDLFSHRSAENLRHLPSRVLQRSRHLMIDNAEDLALPVSGWVRGMLLEIRRRDLLLPAGTNHVASLLVAGDGHQWLYGSKGSTPHHLSALDTLFPAPTPSTQVQLLECFRTHQVLIDAGQNLVVNLSPALGRGTTSAKRRVGGQNGVELRGDDRADFQRQCRERYQAGDVLLILADTPDDIAWVDAAVGDLIREDRSSGARRIRVRPFQKAKALEADTVFLVGDPAAPLSSWYRNQLFSLAGFGVGGDTTPGDTVLRNEALRLVHVAITRARTQCYWYRLDQAGKGTSASSLVSLSPMLFVGR